MHKLAEAAGISTGSVVEIFHEDWGMRKLITQFTHTWPNNLSTF